MGEADQVFGTAVFRASTVAAAVNDDDRRRRGGREAVDDDDAARAAGVERDTGETESRGNGITATTVAAVIFAAVLPGGYSRHE
jgi:hypothetical protein